MTAAAEWAWEDGWVLASIVLANASKHPDLAGVIGIADSINKAVLNRDELERAVNRLTGGGLLHPTEALVPSERAASLWERAQGDGVGWTSVERLVGLLNEECHPLDPDTWWSLSDAEHAEAVGAYLDRFGKPLIPSRLEMERRHRSD